MSSLADSLLGDGYDAAMATVHGEVITVLGGTDAGKTFVAVQDIVEDVIIDSDLGEDRRSQRVLRFRIGSVPMLSSQDRIQTANGKTWTAVRRPGNSYLTVDFELREVVNGKDT